MSEIVTTDYIAVNDIKDIIKVLKRYRETGEILINGKKVTQIAVTDKKKIELL